MAKDRTDPLIDRLKPPERPKRRPVDNLPHDEHGNVIPGPGRPTGGRPKGSKDSPPPLKASVRCMKLLDGLVEHASSGELFRGKAAEHAGEILRGVVPLLEYVEDAEYRSTAIQRIEEEIASLRADVERMREGAEAGARAWMRLTAEKAFSGG